MLSRESPVPTVRIGAYEGQQCSAVRAAACCEGQHLVVRLVLDSDA